MPGVLGGPDTAAPHPEDVINHAQARERAVPMAHRAMALYQAELLYTASRTPTPIEEKSVMTTATARSRPAVPRVGYGVLQLKRLPDRCGEAVALLRRAIERVPLPRSPHRLTGTNAALVVPGQVHSPVACPFDRLFR
ncbi:hypothetical protein ACGF3G_49740 [Streptomyces sp. NPDC048179]|uniref:hypothetical protein n=1 Tax=Streptomyces sp. NPDC048179 TaxID=3365506 RepID=UPI0037134836